MVYKDSETVCQRELHLKRKIDQAAYHHLKWSRPPGSVYNGEQNNRLKQAEVMTKPEKNARERILEAVLSCIETRGLQSLTTRDIAHEAGTNIASINYYFRSKDAAVNEALSMAIKHMQDDIQAITTLPDRSFKETLEEALIYLIEGTYQFPKITMAHLYAPMMEQRYDTIGGDAMREVLERLIQRWKLENPDGDETRARISLAQVMSAALFISFSPGFFGKSLPLNFNQQNERLEYLRHLIAVHYDCR
jgi:AcrR family transcriptional regulator